MSTFFMDFEGYIIGKKVIKEISLLNNNLSKCINIYVNSPSAFKVNFTHPTFLWQYKRHKLPWFFGFVDFFEAIDLINKFVQKEKDVVILVKGTQKCNF